MDGDPTARGLTALCSPSLLGNGPPGPWPCLCCPAACQRVTQGTGFCLLLCSLPLCGHVSALNYEATCFEFDEGGSSSCGVAGTGLHGAG